MMRLPQVRAYAIPQVSAAQPVDVPWLGVSGVTHLCRRGREMLPPILTYIHVYAWDDSAGPAGDHGRSSGVRMGPRTHYHAAAFGSAVVRRIRARDFARRHADRRGGRD